MAEQVNGIGLNVDSGLFEVGATLPQTGSWSIGCDVTIEDVDASMHEVRVNDISLSGNVAIPEVSVDIDANNDKVMDLEIGIIASGLSTGITERQIVPYDKIVKITEFSPESANERRFAASALAAKKIYDLIKSGSQGGGNGISEEELIKFLNKYGYVTEEYVNELLKQVNSFFYMASDGQSIGTPYNLFSEKEISANGLNAGSGGSSGEGGGLIRTVLQSDSFGSVVSNDGFTTFNAFAIDSLHKRIKALEDADVDLTGYATEAWVSERGYITSDALAPYMKTSDAENTFATKSAINTLNESVNSLNGNLGSLASRVKEAEDAISALRSIVTQSGIILANGQSLTFLDASNKEHRLTYDSTAGAFKFDGNVYATEEISANGLNAESE